MLRSLLYILCGFLMIQACSEAPTKIERDNPDDPEVFGFVLNPVQDISTSILEDKVIEVEWTDSSKVPTHYILKKKLRFSDNYIAIDTLNKDARNFIDESREITKDTKYEIISLRKQESGEEVFSQGINSGIEFGGFVSTSQNYNADTTAIIFNWEFETDWPFTVIITTYDNDLEREVVLDTLSNTNTYTTPAFEKDFQYKYFDLKFFVSNRNIDLEKPYKTYTGDYHILDFLPEITNIEVISEGKVVINWEDNTGFEDGFRLLRSKGVNRNSAREREVIAELGPNVTSYTDTLNPITGYARDEFGRESNIKTYYGILVYKNDTQTGTFGAEVQFTPPEVTMNISNMTSNSFRVSWSTTHSDKIDSFILQKSIDGKNFHDYKFFSKHSTEYIESSLNESYTHYFRIKTLTSKKSNTLAVKHSNYLIIENEFDFLNAHHLEFSDSGNLLISSNGFFSRNDLTDVAVFDIQSLNKIYDTKPTGNPVTGIDIDEENKRIALSSGIENEVSVLDYEADTLVFQRSNIRAFDIEFSPSKRYIYTNSANGIVKKIELSSGNEIFSTSEFSTTSTIRALSVSPSGDTIAYNIDGLFKLLDKNGNPINFSHVFDWGSTSSKIDFSKSGKYISNISAFNKAEIHITNPAQRYTHTGAEHITISFDDKFYMTAKSSLLRLFELNTNKQILSHSFSGEVLDLLFSPSEELIAIGSSDGIFLYSISEDKKWSLFRN